MGCTRAADLWSFGIVLFEMLSGSLPFYGESVYEVFQRIVNVEYEFPEGFHSAARDLVATLLVPSETARTGLLRNGMAPIKSHAWFHDIRWNRLVEKRSIALWAPPPDVSKALTARPIRLSQCPWLNEGRLDRDEQREFDAAIAGKF